MKYITYVLLLLAFTLHGNTMAHPLHSTEQDWLGCYPSERFLQLTKASPQTLPDYQQRLVPYLVDRKVSDEASWEFFVQKDLFHISHALSVLFEQASDSVLQNMMGSQASLIEGYNASIDHVGRELYGPLEFYLAILKQMAPEMRLIYLSDIVFPSTQVVKILQQHDASVQGVTLSLIHI